ncbi:MULTISPECIES: acyl carrier protein [unclassified Butyrivibrio]|jgi:acyl carrier protein|uniref:acyl carrier protein n=1 Tax=unclassified Butyrivibrio TaxID=2639466 RepID=UPI0003B419BE|nr:MULTISPECIES: acyl carrier protein [unclassified Butyrivibrio]MDC7294554.1 acyl carrier protein [Butyrivibrio sp. DSM 10294]
MKNEKQFKEFLSQYCTLTPEEMTNDMRLVEDLGLSSFDFMSLLGDMEDNFDVELNIDNISDITTIGQALEFIGAARRTA